MSIRKDLTVHNIDELYKVIDQVGIVSLLSHDSDLPSVGEIVNVEAERPGWVGWGWISKLHYEKKKVIQASFLRTGKITIVSARNLPYYYVSLKKEIEPNELDNRILDFLRANGPTSRRALREALGARGKIIGRSIKRLDAGFLIVRAGIQQPKSGWISRIWDLWDTYIPVEVLKECDRISMEEARGFVLEKYLPTKGPLGRRHLRRLFKWPRNETEETIDRLISEQKVAEGYFIKDCGDKQIIGRHSLERLTSFILS